MRREALRCVLGAAALLVGAWVFAVLWLSL
jgi:hypothetical protein